MQTNKEPRITTTIAELPRPRIGVGVMIVKDGKILLAKRKNAHGDGQYAFPGGHLEYMESFQDCAQREVLEECGITITNIRFLYLANITHYAPKHYINVCLIADWQNGIPTLCEPDKNEPWQWYSLDALPQPLFTTCALAVISYKENINYIDTAMANALLQNN